MSSLVAVHTPANGITTPWNCSGQNPAILPRTCSGLLGYTSVPLHCRLPRCLVPMASVLGLLMGHCAGSFNTKGGCEQPLIVLVFLQRGISRYATTRERLAKFSPRPLQKEVERACENAVCEKADLSSTFQGTPSKVVGHESPFLHGHGSKARTPSEHPNPHQNPGSKMGGEFTYQPKWDPKTI